MKAFNPTMLALSVVTSSASSLENVANFSS
jgi:hypothetical protein